MRLDKAMKMSACMAFAAMLISIPQTKASADKIINAEQGVAGFSTILENATPETFKEAYDTIESLNAKNKSPYANLGVSIADNYVNIRKEPSTDSDVVGKLYRGCAADILERLEGDWVKIKSGDVEGYIASNFLAIGEEAESMVDKYATKWATVNTTTLNVRFEPNTASKIKEQIPIGETYVVLNETEEWAEIILGADEDTQSDYTGFVHKDFVDIEVEFKVAISIEEENRIIREQQEAERAEIERKQKLAQEEAERKERERKEQERKAAETAAKGEKQESSSNSGSSSNYGSSSSASGLQQEIINYALKFVGNPYVWGGTSLTKGADCSGFVRAIYADFGYSIPRVSRDQAASAGRKVSVDDLQPGDLIFYANSRGTVNHVAMYIGNGRIVHAANRRQGIITSKYNYREIKTVRRIVN